MADTNTADELTLEGIKSQWLEFCKTINSNALAWSIGRAKPSTYSNGALTLMFYGGLFDAPENHAKENRNQMNRFLDSNRWRMVPGETRPKHIAKTKMVVKDVRWVRGGITLDDEDTRTYQELFIDYFCAFFNVVVEVETVFVTDEAVYFTPEELAAIKTQQEEYKSKVECKRLEKERREQEYQRQREAQELEQRIDASHLPQPPLQPRPTLDQYPVTGDNRDAYKVGHEIVDFALGNDYVGHNPAMILFYGPVGRGKTHIAQAVAWEIVKTYSVQFWQCEHLLDSIREAYSNHSFDDLMQSLKNCELLIIDDLYRQRTEYSEHDQAKLFELIDYRSAEGRVTIATTNNTLKELSVKNDAIASRFLEGSYHVGGADHRLERALAREKKSK